MSKLTPGELHVMRLLWEQGEMKPAEIQQHYPEDIKNAALRSYLTILLEKGHVSRRKVGKAFYYKAVTRKQSAFKSTLKNLIETYCEGSMQELIMSLIRSEKLTEQDLIALNSIATGKSDSVAVKKTRAKKSGSKNKRSKS